MDEARETAQRAAEAADAKKALDILVLDLRGLTTIADYFVICSATSSTQMAAIADGVGEAMARVGVRADHVEGGSDASWVLMDLGDVVVHIFDEQARAYYGLERLWSDAPRVRVSPARQALQGVAP